MRVLVTGVKGQLGHDVMDELAAKGIEGIGVDVEEMDITDAAACEKVITEAKPDAVIHCIWVCTHQTKEFQNTLVRYSIRPEQSQRKRKFLKKNLALQ